MRYCVTRFYVKVYILMMERFTHTCCMDNSFEQVAFYIVYIRGGDEIGVGRKYICVLCCVVSYVYE